MPTWEKSGCDGTLSISSRTKPGEFWDTGVETDGSGLWSTDSSPSTTCSSDVSIGSSRPVNTDGGELRPLVARHLATEERLAHPVGSRQQSGNWARSRGCRGRPLGRVLRSPRSPWKTMQRVCVWLKVPEGPRRSQNIRTHRSISTSMWIYGSKSSFIFGLT